MSTEYPILHNRPINKWKVTELKEELKRRSLPIKGLKDDLVKRLDEAIRIEWQANKAEENKISNQVDLVGNQMDMDDAPTQFDPASDVVSRNGSVRKGDEVLETPRRDVLISSAASSVGVLDSKAPSSSKIDEEKVDEKKVEVKGLNPQTTVEEYEMKSENKTLESSQGLADHNKAQVFDEISHKLGFKVMSESFSTNTLINNKTELKDNLNDDNVQLESELVRQEMVQPSFGRDSRDAGTIYLSDDLTSHGSQPLHGVTDDKPKKLELSEKNDNEDKLSVGNPVGGQCLGIEVTDKVAYDYGLNQIDSANAASPVPLVSLQETEPPVDIAIFGEENNSEDCHDFNKTIGMMDGELLEKVNLDQSSADEMEEDALDTKLVEPDHDSSKINYPNKEHGVGVGEGLHHFNDHIGSFTALSEKRKLQDVTKSGSNEHLKRQRIETQKERVVLPSERTPTTSLRIDNFVRPFTLKAVHELLAKTGEVCSFWMDHIKTHCYVTFSSAEEAIETRNAVYNLQWPTNGGRLLIADFVDPEEVKMHVEGLSESPEQSANANSSAVSVQPLIQPSESTLQQVPKQHQEPPHPLSRMPPARSLSSIKDQLPLAASLVDDKLEPSMPTLDELFRKTKATPRIYYSPLSDKEVAAKVSRQKR